MSSKNKNRAPIEREIKQLQNSVLNAAKDGDIKQLEKNLSSCTTLESHKGFDPTKYGDLRRYVLNTPSVDGSGLTTTPIIMAARKGHQEVVRLLLSKYEVSVEQIGMVEFLGHPIIKGATPLWCAASIGNLPMVKMLVEEFGAEVDHSTVTNSTPLRPACFDGFLEVVEYLVSKGASVNTPTNYYNNTCLLIACYNGHAEVVKFLLEHGANLETQDFLGQTALHNAAERGNLEIVKELIAYGAQFTPDKKSITPLHVACEFSQIKVMEYFLSLPDQFSKVEKIHAMELLGTSFANGSDDYSIEKVYRNFEDAMKLRYAEPLQLKKVHPPEEVFEFQVECTTLEELRAIAANEDKLNVEALLVKERILGALNVNTIDIIYRGAVLADRRDYPACLKYWDRAMHVKRHNNETIAQDLERYGELFSEMIEGTYPLNFEKIITTLNMCIEELKLDKERITIKKHDSELARINKSIRTNIHTSLFLVNALLVMSDSEKVTFNTKKLVYQLVKLNPVLPTDTRDTLLHIACNCDTVMNEYFIQSLIKCPNVSLIDVLLECGMSPDVKDAKGNTPLHVLCKKINDPAESQVCCGNLLQRGAHVDYRNTAGKMPIDYRAHLDLLNPAMQKRPLKCIAACAVKRYMLKYSRKVPVDLERFIDKH